MKKLLLYLVLLCLACSPSETDDQAVGGDSRIPGGSTPAQPGTGGSSQDPSGTKSTPEADLEDLTRDFTILMETLNVNGAQVAVVRDEKLVYLRSFGLADAFRGTRVSDNSLFRIGGISKPITLMALSRLVSQGKLSTEDLVFGPEGILGTRYGRLPYEVLEMQITVGHLIEHRAGFADVPYDIMFDDPSLSQADLIGKVLDERSLAFEPGTGYAYSNFGYCLLGRIIEAVSGVSYQQYVFEQVLAPMGISRMQVSRDGRGETAPGEVTYYSRWMSPYDLNVTRMDSHGGWLASAYDLALLAAQSDGGGRFPDLLQTGEGLDYLSGGIWSQNGALPGTTALLRVSSGISYVVLMNRGDENFPEVIQYIANFMNGKTLNRAEWPQLDYFRQL